MTQPPIVPDWQYPPDGVLMTFAIYHRHSECSGPYFAVVPWVISSSGQTAQEPLGAVDSLDAARALVPPWADYRFARSANDDPAIVETWL